MTETPGIVREVAKGFAIVEIGPRAAGCGRCHEPGGCGSSLAGGGAVAKPRRYRIANRIGARVGDEVLVTVPGGAVLKASLLAYLIPAICVIVGAVLGGTIGGAASSDAGALVGAVVGLVVGLLVLRVGGSRLLGANEALLSMQSKSCALHLHEDSSSC